MNDFDERFEQSTSVLEWSEQIPLSQYSVCESKDRFCNKWSHQKAENLVYQNKFVKFENGSI